MEVFRYGYVEIDHYDSPVAVRPCNHGCGACLLYTSFRRLQNILYQQILRLKKDTCPNCGGVMRKNNNRLVCDNCNQLMLTKTKCPNPKCRHEYVYMGYEVPAATLQKMQAVSQESFFEWDSLYPVSYTHLLQNESISSAEISLGQVKLFPS